MEANFLVNVAIAGFIWWIGVYILSRNIRSKIALISTGFLASLSVFLIVNNITTNIENYTTVTLIWRLAEWSYLLPIAFLFHFSTLVTGREKILINRVALYFLYSVTIILWIITNRTNLMIDYSNYNYIAETGFYANPRGPLFWLIAPTVIISGTFAAINYYQALKIGATGSNKPKYVLGIISSIFYIVIGPYVVSLYYEPQQINAIKYAAVLLILPFLPMMLAIVKYRLISDVDYIFNWKEFSYLTIAILIINLFNGFIFLNVVGVYLDEIIYVLVPLFIIITILTHSFYDWLSTFIRDLLYNAGKGFSLITDSDVGDVIRNYHNPEKLEASPLARFKAVRKQNKRLATDGIQSLVREAIEYFKQPDYPRRTRQNIKYQILKMMTLDQADEGQILWELGFEGYPMKIMSGEDATRKPLFKIESMSDYTAISRNAFISLKKEAIHDLAWRLSAIERG